MDKMVKVIYALNQNGQKAHLLSGGDGKKFQEIITPATPELIKLSKVDENGGMTLVVSNLTPRYNTQSTGEGFDKIVGIRLSDELNNSFDSKLGRYQDFNAPQTIENLMLMYAEINNKVQSMKLKIDSENEINYEKFKIQEENNRIRITEEEQRNLNWQKEKEMKKLAEEQSKAKYQNEQIEWIKLHGSEYLKMCLELNQKANKEYVNERAMLEFPEFHLDYNETSEWATKVSPSMEALKELKKLITNGAEAEIVWLTKPYDYDYDYDNDFEDCEAIAIRNFLGKYDLIKIM